MVPSRSRLLLGAGLALTLAMGACSQGGTIVVPTVYLLGGQVADPAVSPAAPLAGARVSVETAPGVGAATTDADGIFLLHGVPAGVHRLRAELAGRRSTLSFATVVAGNLTDFGIPLFTDGEIDSILAARGAPPWDRGRALLGLFALRSNGVALGTAAIALAPDAGGTLVQTGIAEDPIVLVNAAPGDYQLSVTRPGFVWDGPYSVHLEAGAVTFGTPRARPNLTGYVFAARTTGAAVEGASAHVLAGPTAATATSDFLGQFSLVGLARGTYVLELSAAGFLGGASWPQRLEQDTTLTVALVAADTLAAWSAAGGGPAPRPDRGQVAVEARSAAGGSLLIGAALAAAPGAGVALAQSAVAPALLLNLPPGTYDITISGPGIPVPAVTRGVLVRAGEVTFSRLDL